MAARFGSTLRRFPLAFLFTLLLTGFFIFLSHDGDVDEKLQFFFIFYFATGALLAVAVTLLTEEFKNRLAALASQVVVHGVWLAVSVYLARFDSFSLPQFVAVAATVFAIGMAIFLICYYRKNQDVAFWNFSISTAASLAVAGVIGGVLTLGLFALIGSLNMLFDLHIDFRVNQDIAAVCMVTLAPALFMNLIPEGKRKFLTTAPEFSRFAMGVVQYLFLPLLGLYLITLYVYAAKILIQWSLPVGGVSYLVSGSMALMVLLIYLTYPIMCRDGNIIFKRIIRLLPVLMLPMLALMTVAIARRLSDYGITVSRLYLLVFNVWCYAVCLWLIFTRGKRIWMVPASFALILFFISVGPQSIPNVTQRELVKEAREAFMASGIKDFPLDKEQYGKWLDSADAKVVARIDSKLHYLNWEYGYDAVKPLLDEHVVEGRYSRLEDSHDDVVTQVVDYGNEDLIKHVALPHGYSRFTMIDSGDCSIERADENIEGQLTLTVDAGNGDSYQFQLAVDDLARWDEDGDGDSMPRAFVLDNGKAMLMLDSFQYYSRGAGDVDFNCTAILFTK